VSSRVSLVRDQVDLDQAGNWVVEVRGDPGGVDEGGGMRDSDHAPPPATCRLLRDTGVSSPGPDQSPESGIT
jgi:hypothetical protein